MDSFKIQDMIKYNRINILTDMKKILFAIIFLVAMSSCRQANELPPLNAGYAKEFIMPDPVRLTIEEREYIQELRDEYNQATLN